MEDNTIKQVLKENLISPEKDDFNNKIIQELNIKQKQLPTLFSEKSILHWFLFSTSFVFCFYIQKESKLDTNIILIGIVFTAIPIYLLIFNKIYSLKNNIR